ncbi:hypothetical protein GCM10010276_72250 [Streptomyces longisporus]|uniref:Uncharacterized protein n=1 Tax=Streptomyces longisporus TaxID=1948 RepID=A0ABN3N497_STRLO
MAFLSWPVDREWSGVEVDTARNGVAGVRASHRGGGGQRLAVRCANGAAFLSWPVDREWCGVEVDTARNGVAGVRASHRGGGGQRLAVRCANGAAFLSWPVDREWSGVEVDTARMESLECARRVAGAVVSGSR